MNNLPLLHSYNSIKKKLAEATIKFEQETEQLRAALAEKDKEMHWKVQRLTAENLKLVKQVERRPQTSHRLERKVAEWRTASQISTRTEDILYHHDTSRLKDLEEAYSVLNTAYDAERNEYKLFKEQKELQLQNIQQLYSESVNDYEVIVSQYHACQLKIEELSNTIQKLTTDAQADKEQFNSELIRWNELMKEQVKAINQSKEENFLLQQELNVLKSKINNHGQIPLSVIKDENKELLKLREENDRLKSLMNSAQPMLQFSTEAVDHSDTATLQNELTATKSQLEDQIKINRNIKKLLAQIGAVGLSDLEIQVPIPYILGNEDFSENGTEQTAKKNHIQLIDLYNHSLHAISKLQRQLESKESVVSSSAVTQLKEERDAWKEATRQLEREIWGLQKQLAKHNEIKRKSISMETKYFDFTDCAFCKGVLIEI